METGPAICQTGGSVMAELIALQPWYLRLGGVNGTGLRRERLPEDSWDGSQLCLLPIVPCPLVLLYGKNIGSLSQTPSFPGCVTKQYLSGAISSSLKWE